MKKSVRFLAWLIFGLSVMFILSRTNIKKIWKPYSYMEDRKELIKSICDKDHDKFARNYNLYYEKADTYKLNGTRVLKKSFFVHEDLKIGWCRIQKVRSSSMQYQFYLILQPEMEYAWDTIYYMMPQLNKETVPPLVKYLMVRHPFQRLLSAYRDKFHGTFQYMLDKFKTKYGDDIIAKYRKTENKDPTFESAPTFREFVQYVIDLPVDQFDIHWLPEYLHCAPCYVEYDSIIHTETYDDDINHLIGLTGIKKLRIEGHLRKTEVMSFEFIEDRNFDVSERHIEELYFSTLDASLFDGLKWVYGIDLDMFGYSVEPYESYVSNLTWEEAQRKIVDVRSHFIQ